MTAQGRPPLWAPWRMEYIESDKSGECVFCEPARPRPDRERLILYRGERVFVLLNRYPYAAGHVMVAPYTHAAHIHELTGDTMAELIARIADSTRILEAAFGCQGINVGANLGAAAGAGIADHLHFHVVPRWPGDVNFMTSIAETRVIPEHLDRTWEKLAPRFEEVEGA